jgi:hypothetical protein
MGAQIYRAVPTSNYGGLWSLVVMVTLYSLILFKVIGAVEGRVLAKYAPQHGR